MYEEREVVFAQTELSACLCVVNTCHRLKFGKVVPGTDSTEATRVELGWGDAARGKPVYILGTKHSAKRHTVDDSSSH